MLKLHDYGSGKANYGRHIICTSLMSTDLAFIFQEAIRRLQQGQQCSITSTTGFVKNRLPGPL